MSYRANQLAKRDRRLALDKLVSQRPTIVADLKSLGPTQRWRCVCCAHTATEHSLYCKSCHGFNTYVIARVFSKEAEIIDVDFMPEYETEDDELIDELDESSAPRAVVASSVTFGGHVRLPMCVPGIDEMLNGGVVKGQVSAITGDPGVGKSTLIMQAEVSLCKRKMHVLHCDAEEVRENIMGRMVQVGGASKKDLDYLHILTSADDGASFIEQCYMEAERIKPAMMVINSANEYYAHDTIGQPILTTPGDPLLMKRVSEVCYTRSHKLEIPTWVFVQVTKEGGMSGPQKFLHRVDAAFSLKRADDFEDSGIVIMQTEENKNRFGNSRIKSVFEWVDDKHNRELAYLRFIEKLSPKGRKAK